MAPSEYLAKLEAGSKSSPLIQRANLDAYLRSHLLDPDLVRADSFDAFMADRQRRLLSLIERATGRPAYAGAVEEEGEDVEVDDDAAEAELTIAVAT